MKNIFTFGIFLTLLLGIGNNVSAATITAVATLTDANWATAANWDSGTVPTYADDVVIPAGDSISTTATTYCNSLTVGGKFYNGGTFYVNGTITVNSGGVFNIHNTLYCYNITNNGKFWNPSQPFSGSPKNLFLGCGFTFTAPSTYTTVYGIGDYLIQNDGVFGTYRAQAVAKAGGGGIYIYYSNLASSVTIQPSSTSVTNYAFNIAALAPYANATTASSQNFTLNIKESMTLLRYSSVLGFSLQNGEASSALYSRTCNIFAGDTVFVGGNFHTRGSVPSVNQGDIIYNVYGCLDVATYHPGTINEIDLYSTSFVGNTSALKINVGDGTLANAGTLVLGVATKLTKTLAGQTVGIFPSAYSTITFGYTATIPLITCTTAGATDNTLFPSAFNNLAITNTVASIPVTLPNNPSVSGKLSLTEALNNTVTLNGTAAQTITGGGQTVTGLTLNNPAGASLASALNVSGALTLTSGKLTLGNSNLTIGATGSIAGSSASNYVVTNGTGTLSQTALALGTLYPIGTTTGYAPATITPAADGIISANVSATPTGAFTGYDVNLNEWTLTPATATTATLAFTPTTAANTTSPVAILSGAVVSGNYATATTATLSGSTYSASGIALAASATPFATAGTTPATAIQSKTTNNLLIYSGNNSVVIRNATMGELVTVYGVSGLKVASSVVKGDNTTMTLLPGIYIVKAGSIIQKVSVQ